MKQYKQLTLSQRYQIQTLLQISFNQSQVASQLGVSKSTIIRELKRNIPTRRQTTNTYLAEHAQRKTNDRYLSKPNEV